MHLECQVHGAVQCSPRPHGRPEAKSRPGAQGRPKELGRTETSRGEVEAKLGQT